MSRIVLETFTFDSLLADPLTHAVMASDGVSLGDLIAIYGEAAAAHREMTGSMLPGLPVFDRTRVTGLGARGCCAH